MNEERRKKLKEVQSKISDAQSEIKDIKSTEEEAYDNMPDSLKEGEKGEKAQGVIEALSEAHDALQNASDQIDSAIE
jgi:hypothetical protein